MRGRRYTIASAAESTRGYSRRRRSRQRGAIDTKTVIDLDANDLLIFKLRGVKKDEKVSDKSKPAPAPAAAIKANTKTAPEQVQPTLKSSSQQAAIPDIINSEQQRRSKEGLVLAQEKADEEESMRLQSQNRKGGGLFSVFAKKEDVEPPEPQPIQIERKESAKTSMYDAMHHEKKGVEPPRGMSKEQSKELALNKTCIYHPWRDAYAVCSHCKIAFCYADIVEHDDGFYCIEDSEKAYRKDTFTNKIEANAAIKISSLVLLVVAGLLFYYTYSQVFFILGNLGLNWSHALSNLQYSYAIALFNMVLALITFVDAIVILAFASRRLEVSEMVMGIVILAMSFEYMNSSVTYLIAIGVLAAGALMSMLISRMLENTLEFAQEAQEAKVRWPRLETFG